MTAHLHVRMKKRREIRKTVWVLLETMSAQLSNVFSKHS